MSELSDDEQRAINTLRRLAKKWPATLWLFSASGSLCVMRRDDEGHKAKTPDGGFDPNYAVADIRIPNDGGDW